MHAAQSAYKACCSYQKSFCHLFDISCCLSLTGWSKSIINKDCLPYNAQSQRKIQNFEIVSPEGAFSLQDTVHLPSSSKFKNQIYSFLIIEVSAHIKNSGPGHTKKQ